MDAHGVTRIDRKLSRVTFYDQFGKPIGTHTIDGMIFLGLPNAAERMTLGENKEKGAPLISIQSGDPLIVLNLMNILQKMLPDMMADYAARLEGKTNAKS